ncbi:hypothetical protein BFP97_18170 [Roseivirga sp. 4D4]|nr:hypothetical protein BFP97_18170 [Roseivirga sp. 4D4]
MGQYWTGSSSTTNYIYRTGSLAIGTNYSGARFTVGGSVNKSHFYHGTYEDVYLRPGTNSGRVIMDIGNVGIGTSSPNYKLDVNGRIHSNDRIYGDRLSAIGGVIDLDAASGSNFWQLYGGAASLYVSGQLGLSQRAGNVGIGTTNPTEKLDIHDGALELMQTSGVADNGKGVIKFGENSVRLFAIQYNGSQSNPNNKLMIKGSTSSDDSYNLNLMTFDQNGHVGVGMSSPQTKLNIYGKSQDWDPSVQGHSLGTIHLNPGSSNDNYGNAITFGASDSGSGQVAHAGIYVRSDGAYGTKMYFSTTNAYITGSKTGLMIDHTGSIGIGTSDPTEKLSVDGTVLAKKIRVSTTGVDWPDYVFSPEYKLKTLGELEDYIQANQHLPEVPSAQEIEEKGQDLGDIQATLLKKVEELTLYILELEAGRKELEVRSRESEVRSNKLDALNSQLQTENAELRAMFLELKKEIELIKAQKQ